MIFRNNKRVAEIWLDGYKKYLYARHPERYENLDIGDISHQLSAKQKLNCKPFSYFLEEVAPDMLERFPLEDFKHFASGTVRWSLCACEIFCHLLLFQIRNKAVDKCLQTTDKDHGGHISLVRCSHNKTNPIAQQHFVLRHFRDIMIHGKSDCLEGSKDLNGLTYERCHYQQGTQYFRYEIETLHLVWGRKQNNLCIDADPVTGRVFINFCHDTKITQKWVWGFSRVSWLRNWAKYGAPIMDDEEKSDVPVLENSGSGHDNVPVVQPWVATIL